MDVYRQLFQKHFFVFVRVYGVGVNVDGSFERLTRPIMISGIKARQ